MSDTERIGGWDECEEHAYVVGLDVDDAERLAWLEEMLVLAFASGALPKRRDAWGRTLPPGADDEE